MSQTTKKDKSLDTLTAPIVQPEADIVAIPSCFKREWRMRLPFMWTIVFMALAVVFVGCTKGEKPEGETPKAGSGTESEKVIQEATQALREGNHRKALEILVASAREGNPKAQASLGDLYLIGIGVEKNYETATTWYKKAATQEFPYAEGMMGKIYEEGLGVPKDDHTAYEWYHRAATHGDPNSQHNLAVFLGKGKGVKDQVEAVKWFQEAANQGSIESMYALGSRYFRGRGVREDRIKAIEWYDLAMSTKLKTAARRTDIETPTFGMLLQAIAQQIHNIQLDASLNVGSNVPGASWDNYWSEHSFDAFKRDYDAFIAYMNTQKERGDKRLSVQDIIEQCNSINVKILRDIFVVYSIEDHSNKLSVAVEWR